MRLHGRDHYWHRSDTDEFFAGDLIGLIDALSEVEHIDWWGAGRTIATSEFREILSRAIEDADFQSDSTEKIGDPSNFVSEPVAV